MSAVAEVAGFPITADVVLKAGFEHLDIHYQVTNHSREKYRSSAHYEPSDGTYCYYVLIGEKQLSAEEFAEFWLPPQTVNFGGRDRISYDYYDTKWSDAKWHGGVTWYSKEGGLDGNPRGVKIGCDYGHYGDEYSYPHLDSVKADALATVESLRSMYTFFRRDRWNGEWMRQEEMVEHEGCLYTPAGLAARTAYFQGVTN